MATRKYRKELLLSVDEIAELRILAARFKIDVTSMLRMLIQLGKETLPPPTYAKVNLTQGHQT